MDTRNLGAYVVFSIDRQNDPIFVNAFAAAFAAAETKGRLVPLIGCYKGEREVSFIAYACDFWAVAYEGGWARGQESILFVTECNKQYATLLFLADGRTEALGSLKSVSKAEALAQDAWSYNPRTGNYFIAAKGNPDTVLERGVALPGGRCQACADRALIAKLAIPGTPPAKAYAPAHGGYPAAGMPALEAFRGTPDDWAEIAEMYSRAGARGMAREATLAAHRARARWLMFDGRWIARPLSGRIAE